MTMNRFIAEKVMGVKWHDWGYVSKGGCLYFECSCGDNCRWRDHDNPDYSTRDKAALMDFCVEQEWWERFCRTAYGKRVNETYKPMSDAVFYAYLWRNLPKLVAEYHGWKEAK